MQFCALVVSFVNPLSVFPTNDITFCSVPHIHIHGSINQSVHIILVSNISLCVTMSFEENSTTYIQATLKETDTYHVLVSAQYNIIWTKWPSKIDFGWPFLKLIGV